MPAFITWNVNSLRVRLPQVLALLAAHPDVSVVGLQETKVSDAEFPQDAFREAGWQVVFTGQAAYNGVALLSRVPLQEITQVLHPQDVEKRFLAATWEDWRIINIYAPNGQAVGSEKYRYKLAWYEALTRFLEQSLMTYPKICVLGDFNIAPKDVDVYDPVSWGEDILCSPLERAAFFELENLGLVDALRLQYPEGCFTWWDYRQGAFRRNWGVRIDHILFSRAVVEGYTCDYRVLREWRAQERPSDHAPLLCQLSPRFS